MSYCLNPKCPKPQNLPGATFCSTCGTKMLLKDRYRATDFLGAGGMGRNFLAVDEDTPSKKRCVIKQFSPHPDIVSNPATFQKAIELFNREAAMLDRLGDESSQIPRLLAYFEQDKRLYFVQEFVDGQNLLKELEEKGIYNEAQIYQLLNDLLPVLKFIHDRDVIHRDIKPENIMRRQNGQLVLIDFGISKELSGTVSSLGTTVGTLGYAPPEQMTYGVAYPASDIYALGVTCIHLITNVYPDELFNPQENRWLWRDMLAKKGIYISQQLDNILEKILKIDLGERYKSVDEVVKDLNPIMVGIWYGEFDDAPATLFIHRHSDEYFDGTLAAFHSDGLTYVAIQGNLDPKTNKVTIKELHLLPKSKSKDWTLGKNQGIMSLDGKELIGKGKAHTCYWWSFSKEDMNGFS